jgi:Cd2+/Zn2+-exporting ATPase/Cu+-exporting ATPase
VAPDDDRGGRPPLDQAIGWVALGGVAAVVIIAALGESLGWFDAVLERLPWWIPAVAIVLGGWKVFRGVARAALRRQVTGHTLMTVGVVASAAIGQWTTAALIVFFMRFADFLEDRTTERSRTAIQSLVRLSPATARVVRDGEEVAVPVSQLRPGDLVAVRPGERIPVDGEIADGSAPVDQAPITGESVPVDKGAGDQVFAASVVQAGYLRVRATSVGDDTTFARIVRLVEEAEANRAPVQRFADRFASFYLPAVLLIGLATFLVTRNVFSAVAVLVVACACAITMATPVVVLASVGNAARRGLLVKGGAALEQLARVDAVLIDKTGTLTFGRPELTDVLPFGERTADDVLATVAAIETRSEHPLGQAMVEAARRRGVRWGDSESFRSLPGLGVTGKVNGRELQVGNRRLLAAHGTTIPPAAEDQAAALEEAGQTVFFVAVDGTLGGLIALRDTVRPEARDALAQLRRLGVGELLVLTGDSAAAARAVSDDLGVPVRAELLPEDKIAAVRELQAQGRTVMMVGDGVNDAPALAQADVGVAMGVDGTAVAVEAANVALLRDDWLLVPAAIRLGRRSAGTIRQNLAFAAVYNVVGMSLAAVGLLPPVWAAAAQSLPDMAVMLNSARLLRARLS